MSEKAHIWEYLDNNSLGETEENRINNNEYSIHNQSKRIKNAGRNHINQDVAWIKTLLHPSMEKSFTKFEVSSVISATKTKLILNLKPIPSIFPEIDYLIGFFDAWWWKNSLSKVEFNTIQELFDVFPFLKRTINNENIVKRRDNFDLLLLNNPKVIRDETDSRRGLITCKQFLIIE